MCCWTAWTVSRSVRSAASICRSRRDSQTHQRLRECDLPDRCRRHRPALGSAGASRRLSLAHGRRVGAGLASRAAKKRDRVRSASSSRETTENSFRLSRSRGLPGHRNVVLFQWEAGDEPAANDVAGFELLGETAARMHQHVRAWTRPSWFTRHTWDFEHQSRRPAALGTVARRARHDAGDRTCSGGDGRPHCQAARALRQKRAVFNLIHGDMRLANLLTDQGQVKVIDFDDCGLSWFLYDCATTVSFFEDAPEVPELIKAWVRGYRRIGTLDAAEAAEIEDLRHVAAHPAGGLDRVAFGNRSRALDGRGLHAGNCPTV